MDLFDQSDNLKKSSPLADRMRPESLDDFFGQEHLVGEGKILRQLIEQDNFPSIIFWGPPGTGKTTLAKIVARTTQAEFVSISAVNSGVSQLKDLVTQAVELKKFHGRRTIIFIDEVHRWNKSQQDSLLPHVENGTVVFIGATTENPSFAVNSALLSRARVFVLEQLSSQDIFKILKRAVKNKIIGLGHLQIKIKDSVLNFLANLSNGDARVGLNALETIFGLAKNSTTKEISLELVKESLHKSNYLYDKTGDQHYNLISALHKSLRGSDDNAALYWLVRMLEAGEDPLYVARRLVRFASEDVGLANSQALVQAMSGLEAVKAIGMPEANVVLAQVVVYLARCKKSNELYRAYNEIAEEVRKSIDEPVPIHLRNAPTKFMKNLGYGKDYKYSPEFNYQEQQTYLPKKFIKKKWLRGQS